MTKIEIALAALKQWKCPACGGSGKYEHHGQRGEFERTGRELEPHPEHRITDCKKCGGDGLHPIARDAIAQLEQQ